MKTSSELVLEDEWHQRVLIQIEHSATEKVNACMREPDKFLNDPDTALAAYWAYAHYPIHQCYWNDRFAIAVMCNLPFRLKQEAARKVVENGRTEYFEWNTHSKYSMKAVFERLGIDVSKMHSRTMESSAYFMLPDSINDALHEIFNLAR